MARVGRRRRAHRRGRRGPRRPRPPRGGASPSCASGAKIGSFSAASNVTGIVTDVDAGCDHAAPPRRARALRLCGCRPVPADRHERLARPPGRAPCVQGRGLPLAPQVPRRPREPRGARRQAGLLRTAVPTVPGGGTILFVSPTAQSYHPDPEIREEGGTPAIVESIRAGLAFALKEAVGVEEIRRREQDLARRALRSWSANPRIEILGSTGPSGWRWSRSACAIRRGHLHASFVVTVLSDLFGSRREAAASARAPTSTAPSRSTSCGRGAWTPRSGGATSAPSSRSPG